MQFSPGVRAATSIWFVAASATAGFLGSTRTESGLVIFTVSFVGPDPIGHQLPKLGELDQASCDLNVG
jgi:hypothetical protein